MAEFLKKYRERRNTLPLLLLRAAVYAAMLLLICIYFAGGAEFIYEAF